MPALLSLSYKSLVSSVTRWLLALLAIALGVAGIVSSLTINDALTRSLDSTASAVLGNADVELVAMDERGFSAGAAATLAALPQVQTAAARLTKLTYFELPNSTTRGFLNITGIDPTLDPQLHPLTILAGQTLNATDDGLLVPREWADSVGLGPGAVVRMITSGGFQNFTIRGLFGGASSLVYGDHPAAFVTSANMQQNFALGARVSEIGLRFKPGQAAAAPAAIAAALPEPYNLRDLGAVQEELASNQRDFRWLLELFGVVAIVAGGVEILNTLSILANRRTRELALMRAAGATRGQVTGVLLLEALMIGLAGSILGVVLGWLFAGLLGGLVQSGRGIDISVAPDPVVGLAGLLAGVLVALLAALLPAWNVARREPLDMLHGGSATLPTGRTYVLPAIASLILLVIFGFVAWSLLASGSGTQPELLLAGFAAVLFLGLVLILLALVPLLIAIAGALLRRSGAGLALLAQRSLRWRSGRTAMTASALTIAVAVLTTLLVLAASAGSAGQQTVKALFAAPWVVVAPVAQPGDLAQVVAAESGAASVSPMRKVTLSWEGRYVDAVALDPVFYAKNSATLPLERGDRTAALVALGQGDAVLAPTDFADRYGLGVGSTMNIWTPDGGPQPFKIVGLLRRSFPAADSAGALVFSINTLQAHYGVNTFTQLLVTPDGSADFAARLAATAERYGMQAQSTDQIAADIERSIAQTLLLFGALTGTAALVGALSIVNAMSLNVLERAPVIGLLRAAGMSTGQVAITVVLEAALLGLLAGVLGVVLGSGIGWLLFGAGRISVTATYAVPWWIILLIPATALLAMLASLYPARQASSTPAMGVVRSPTA